MWKDSWQKTSLRGYILLILNKFWSASLFIQRENERGSLPDVKISGHQDRVFNTACGCLPHGVYPVVCYVVRYVDEIERDKLEHALKKVWNNDSEPGRRTVGESPTFLLSSDYHEKSLNGEIEAIHFLHKSLGLLLEVEWKINAF